MSHRRLINRFILIAILLALSFTAMATITLRFSTWDGDKAVRVLRQLCREFERQNPGVHVQLEGIGDYGLYHQKMVIEYAANDAPDVAMMDVPHFQALVKRHALLPLNQFFHLTPGFKLSEYYKPIVDAHSLNGKLYVLPRDIAPEGIIYYNKKIFKEEGIPYPDGSWTWDFKPRPWLKNEDFWTLVKKLTQFNKDGSVKRYGFIVDGDQMFLETLAFSYGLRYADNPYNPTKLLTDSPGWIKVGNLMQTLEFKDHWIPSANEVSSGLQSSAYQLFVQGKCAMFQSGIWMVPLIRESMTPGEPNFFDWDIAMAPRYYNKPLGMPTGGSGYAIFSTTKHPKLAWKLARFMAGPIGMTAMAKAGVAQPAMRKVALSSAWIPNKSTPVAQQYPWNRIITDKEVKSVVFSPSSPDWPDVSGIFYSKMDNFFNGIQPASVVFPEATHLAQKRLDYLRKKENLPLFQWGYGIAIGVALVGLLIGWIYWPERGRKLTEKQKRENKSAYKFILPWLAGMIFFTVGPMILSLLMCTTDWDLILPAHWRGLGNFQEAFTVDPRFWISLKVTFIYTIVRVPMTLIFALAFAVLLNVKVKGIALYRAFFYMPSLASGVAAALIWKRLFNPDQGIINAVLYSHWLNRIIPIGHWLSDYAGTPGVPVNWLGNDKTALASFIVMSIWGVGGATIILLAGLQGISDSYYEAATMDGANLWNKFKAITFPMITPALFFTLVTGLIGAFQDFTDVYVVTGSAGGPNNSTLLYMLNLYIQGFQDFRFGYVAALSWVLFVIIMIVTWIQFKGSKWVYYESDTN